MSFLAGAFALAGLACAAGPLIIHLLHRRRYRTVEWAAMDFLREAVKRQRSLLRLRDILLLVVRTVCVVLFGLALARPYVSRSEGVFDVDQPIHAVVVVDNSLSMAYANLEGSLLDEAKAKAREFLEALPVGSRATVLPLCGDSELVSLDAAATIPEALEILDSIRVVDTVGFVTRAIDLSEEACRRLAELPTKRVVWIGDGQRVGWPDDSLERALERLPPVQIARVGPDAIDNAWVASLRVQDEVADTASPTVIVGEVAFEGSSPRSSVPVRLVVDGTTVATQEIDLEPGQRREVLFSHRFEVPAREAPDQPGGGARRSLVGHSAPYFAAVDLVIEPDSLTLDDERHLVVPVVASLPVVFVDEVGSEENPATNNLGETIRLRRLLAPQLGGDDAVRPLVKIRHTSPDDLSEELLRDARLVVVAGVERPGSMVSVLREYVEQGGQLVVTAGGSFDPGAWTVEAWLDGRGILPAPLEPTPFGALPSSGTAALDPFFLDVDSLSHDYFRLPSESDAALRDIFQEPLFFQAVVARVSDDVRRLVLESERSRLRERAVENRESRPVPEWLEWGDVSPRRGPELAEEQRAQRGVPRVLGGYTGGLPFLVEREIGAGRVLLFTTGVYTEWSTLTTTHAVFLFDRIFRMLLQETFRDLNHETGDVIEIPVAAATRRANVSLSRPGESGEEPVSIDAHGKTRYSVALRRAFRRGHYRIAARLPDDDRLTSPRSTTGGMSEADLWSLPVAVNGPERESDPARAETEELSERAGDAKVRFVAREESLSVEGALIEASGIWRFLLLALLLLLLVELGILASRRFIVEREVHAR